MSREYRVILGVLIVLSDVAWGVTVRRMGGMGVGWVMGSMTMGRPFSAVNALVYVGLWGVMMVAMMFPAVAPVAGTFAGLTRQTLPDLPMRAFVLRDAVVGDADRRAWGYAGDLDVRSLPDRFPILKTYATQIGRGPFTKPRRDT